MRKPEDVLNSIDQNALYTVEKAARLLMEIDPSLSFEEAIREVRMAIESGELPIAGHLSS